MRVTLLLILGCLMYYNTTAQNLEKHQWRNRVLIVKSENDQNKIFQDQLKELESNTDELSVRKIVFYQIVDSKYELLDYSKKDKNVSGRLSNQLAEEMLHKNNEFEIILIGLDGGIKLRKTEILTTKELFQTIDSMPMRKAELRKKKLKH